MMLLESGKLHSVQILSSTRYRASLDFAILMVGKVEMCIRDRSEALQNDSWNNEIHIACFTCLHGAANYISKQQHGEYRSDDAR